MFTGGKSTEFSKKLEAEIVSGKIPAGYRIPGERDLAAKYSLSHMTVNKAVSGLVAKGLLVRKGNHGTFVADRSASVFSRTAALLFDANPAHHNPFLSELPRALQKAGFNALLIDTDPCAERTPRLNDMSGISAFIAHTAYDFPLGALGQLPPSSKLVLIDEPLKQPSIPFSTVIPDFKSGAFEAMRLFAEKGRGRIAVVMPGGKGNPRARMLEEGIETAQKEFGFKHPKMINTVEDGTEMEPYSEIFNEKGCPDAVFAHNDYDAMRIIRSAKISGLRVPEDVVVVGYYNTPWSESYDITTFSLEPQKISEAVLMLLNSGPGIEILVKPRLILKRTCYPDMAVLK